MNELADMWNLIFDGSDELADELHISDPRFSPRAIEAVDRWLARRPGPLGEEDLTRLGLYLARLLVETHKGGLVKIRRPDHLLHNEWAITGFARGLPNDYHLPYFVSAARIGQRRELSVRDWYEQLLREAEPG